MRHQNPERGKCQHEAVPVDTVYVNDSIDVVVSCKKCDATGDGYVQVANLIWEDEAD